jgi:hypothetical protein
MKSSFHILIPFLQFLLKHFRLPTISVLTIISLSGSYFLYDWRFIANQFLLAKSPLRLTTSNFIFQLNICGFSPYVTSRLMRGWVYRLRLLQVLVNAVIIRSDSRATHDRILLSQNRDSPNLKGQVPVFISPRNRLARLYSQALGSLFVSSYDSQGYAGLIRPRLHTGSISLLQTLIFITSRHETHRKHCFLTIPLLLQRCVYLAVA